MLPVQRKQLLLEPTTLTFESEGVFNPACMQENGQIHMFYRAVRPGNYSSIGYCLLDRENKLISRHKKPLLFPEYKYESQGMEDPRICKVEDTYLLTYSAYDRVNVFGALATSEDLKHFSKVGIITPQMTYREYKHLIECCNGINEKYMFHYKIFMEHGLGQEIADKLYLWDKNLMFFPRKIDGKFALIHRIHPGVQLVLFEDFRELTRPFWDAYMMRLDKHTIMDPSFFYESSHIGGGAPPIETDEGWLFIYHAAEHRPTGLHYHASAALLDLDNPLKVKGRLDRPLISPELPWEQKGVVNNVIFPTGTAVFDDELHIYYGAADRCVGVATLSLSSLLKELLRSRP